MSLSIMKPRIEGMKYTESPYDSMKYTRFKLFIDHIDNEDKRIWAVIVDKKYLTAKKVKVYCKTEAAPLQRVQPHAYVYGRGRVIQVSKDLIRIY